LSPCARRKTGRHLIECLGIPADLVQMVTATDHVPGMTPMPYTYDDTNIFARILRGEIPNKTILETAHTLVFHDIRPHAPSHVLVIPKGPYVTFDHFAAEASAEELVDFHRAAAQVCAVLGIAPGMGGTGYRAIANAGSDSNQEVPHYHLHILGGRNLGPLLA
jgi:histidine triad (HIT) family protein